MSAPVTTRQPTTFEYVIEPDRDSPSGMSAADEEYEAAINAADRRYQLAVRAACDEMRAEYKAAADAWQARMDALRRADATCPMGWTVEDHREPGADPCGDCVTRMAETYA